MRENPDFERSRRGLGGGGAREGAGVYRMDGCGAARGHAGQVGASGFALEEDDDDVYGAGDFGYDLEEGDKNEVSKRRKEGWEKLINKTKKMRRNLCVIVI